MKIEIGSTCREERSAACVLSMESSSFATCHIERVQRAKIK